MGVNKTRRFLLEWLSFTCRYIPVGILEVLPQRINERPPPFVSDRSVSASGAPKTTARSSRNDIYVPQKCGGCTCIFYT